MKVSYLQAVCLDLTVGQIGVGVRLLISPPAVAVGYCSSSSRCAHTSHFLKFASSCAFAFSRVGRSRTVRIGGGGQAGLKDTQVHVPLAARRSMSSMTAVCRNGGHWPQPLIAVRSTGTQPSKPFRFTLDQPCLLLTCKLRTLQKPSVLP